MTDLAVHDGPIFAFTMVRNSHELHPARPPPREAADDDRLN
jgi:hypothetical protein